MLPIQLWFPVNFIIRKSKKICSLSTEKQRLFFEFFAHCMLSLTNDKGFDGIKIKPIIKECDFPHGSVKFFDEVIYPYVETLHSKENIKVFLKNLSREQKKVLAFIVFMGWHDFRKIEKKEKERKELLEIIPNMRMEMNKEEIDETMHEPEELQKEMINGEII